MITALALVAMLGWAQAAAPSASLDRGIVTGDVYSNAELGLTYQFPVGWTAEPRVDGRALDVTFTPPSTDGNSIEMFVLDTSLFPHVTPLRAFRKSDAGVKYSLDGAEVRFVDIGSGQFLRSDWIREAEGGRLYQSRLVADSKGWRIIFFITGPRRNTIDAEIAALSQLRFDPIRTTAGPPGPVFQKLENTTRGKLLKKVQPVYPRIALNRRLQGSVIFEAIIGRDGTIKYLEPFAGEPALIEPAMDAVRQWQYEPYLVDGEPVEVCAIVTVNFSIGG